MALKNKLAKFVPGNLYYPKDFMYHTMFWRTIPNGIYQVLLEGLSTKDQYPILYLGPMKNANSQGEFLVDGEIWYSNISNLNRPSFSEEEKHYVGCRRS